MEGRSSRNNVGIRNVLPDGRYDDTKMLKLGFHQCDNFHRSEVFGATIFILLMGTSER